MEIPFGSKFHDNAGPCTAWGVNQRKIAMTPSGDVYSGYMDNDDVLGFVVYAWRYDNWRRGAKLKTQRPGNVLLDCFGNLHVFVVDGRRLMHHVFRNGNVRAPAHSAEVYDHCNIRFSVDIRGPRVFVCFGDDSRMHFLDGYIMRSGIVPDWRHRRSMKLPCDFAYPFALIRRSGALVALAEERKACTMSCLFHEDNLNLPHVLEHYTSGARVNNNDLFEDSSGVLHAIVRITAERRTFVHAREIDPGANRFARTSIDHSHLTNIRLTEDLEDGVQYVGSSWDKVWRGTKHLEDITPAEMNEREECAGIVPFVVDADVLVIPSAEVAYPDARPFLVHTGVSVVEYKARARARCSEWAWSILDTMRYAFSRVSRCGGRR